VDGLTVLVTGSTDGIGEQTAVSLAVQGCRVILHGRNGRRLHDTALKIARRTGRSLPAAYEADFSSMHAVRNLARSIAADFDRLDVLINNAGVYMPRRTLTGDGLETTFAVNHLAHFQLTLLLLPLLEKSAPARIVNVSSVDHFSGRPDPMNLQGEHAYSGYDAYALSKLCNIAFTIELADRLAPDAGITVNALDPGVIATKLLHAGWNLMGDDVSRGAGPLVHLACSPDVSGVTGCYFECNRPVECASRASDPGLRGMIWEKSLELLDLPESGEQLL
jgi:NAD(P)-dependent dehydrogenase (short-subunit alcohol dehydrogenase family)